GQGSVWSLASVQVDGRALIARGGADGLIRLIDAEDGTEVDQIEAHRGPVRALVAIPSEDGRDPYRLARGGLGGDVRLWDLAGRVELVDPTAGTVVRSIRAHRSTVWALAPVTVGGRQLLATGGADAQVYLWDPATGAPARQFAGHLSTIRAMTAVQTEGGQRLATGSADSTIRLWNPASTSDSPEHTFSDNSGEVWALTPVVGGRGLIAGGGAEGTIFLYNPVTRQTSSLLAGSANTVWALAALDLAGHPVLASGGVEGPISLIELERRTVD